MGWERRGEKHYYYQSKGVGGNEKKVYFGGGVTGQIAEELDRRCRADRAVAQANARAAKARLKDAQQLLKSFIKQCDLLVDAVLLAAGFHRPKRQGWRKWHAARRYLTRNS